MRDKTLTARQRDVLEAIRKLSANGTSPTLAELGDHVGIRSLTAVQRHLDNLENKKFLKARQHYAVRSICLTRRAQALLAA
jgi:SOS-response transcriptional repressor LexA